MADEIVTRCANLKLTEDDANIVALDDVPEIKEDSDLSLSLVGKVLTVRSYNFDAMKKTLNQIWTISKNALFRPIENGLFVVQFVNPRDKMKVMAGRPWTFDQNLVILNEIEGNAQPSSIALNHSPFWARLYNLPMNSRSEKCIRAIGGGLGTVLEVESDGVVWDKSARLKILVDVTKPLRRLQQVRQRDGSTVVVEVKYERLPNFCYCCGVLGHIERDCLNVGEDDKDEERLWGSWLRASPRRGRLKMEEEAKNFKSCAKTLHFSPASALNKKGVVDPLVGSNDDGSNSLTAHDLDPKLNGGVLPIAEVCSPHTLNNVSTTPPLIFKSGCSSPRKSKSTKTKNLSRKKPVIQKAPNLVKECCLNVDINMNSGLKRKQTDDMLVDDTVDLAMGQKKTKFDFSILSGSAMDTVEAEVGETQPRPAL